jgi:very-short-patch-repair endonuclease
MLLLDPALRDLAAAQRGAFSSRQAARHAVSRLDLYQLLRAGHVVRVRRGAFVVASALDGLTPEERYSVSAQAVLLSRDRPAWASHHAALKPTVVAGDAALRAGLVSDDKLGEAADRLELGDRAAQRVARLRSLLDGSGESPGESLARLLFVGLGLDFRSQVDIRDAAGFVGRVDFLVGGRAVVEFDGLVKYAGADGRDALVREKRREDRLRAAGYEVVRLTWADLDAPERMARLVREAQGRARARG